MMFGYQWRRGVDSWAMNRLNICIKWARDSAQKCFTCDNLAQITTSTIAEVFAILSPKKKSSKENQYPLWHCMGHAPRYSAPN